MESPLISSWLQDLNLQSSKNQLDEPHRYVSDPRTLITSSTPSNFSLGNGLDLLTSAFSKIVSDTKHELIIVTCFWTASDSLNVLCSALATLSSNAISRGYKIRVRICFSSTSIWQKLTHTTNLDGNIYPPSSWAKLGLPPSEQLQGLDLVVKSVFVLPFSVMHPKFIISDREKAWLPSCNVSWENWFEGCVDMEGEIVGKLFDFWSAFWSRGCPPLPALPLPDVLPELISDQEIQDESHFTATHISGIVDILTILLPSPHHMNPHIRVLGSAPPPPTPLNLFVLNIFAHAKKSIYIQTPNLTSAPVIEALFTALERGIDIHLVTSAFLMIPEQLVTAGTITEYEVWKLTRRYKHLHSQRQHRLETDPEAELGRVGMLRIGYYHPKTGMERTGDEPVKSHLKCMVMDEEVTVLGSGNMDRASWYTSQELGVAFFSENFARLVMGEVERELEKVGSVKYVC